MSNECPNGCGELADDKFKDALDTDWGFFTVYLTYCASCGYIDDENTWVEW